MAMRRGTRPAPIATRVLHILAGALVAITLLVAAPPLLARYLLLHELSAHGLQASIGRIDVDILTGRLQIDDLRGRDANGAAFHIGRLGLNLDYAALLQQHIRIAQLTLADAGADVRRAADGRLRVAGIALPGSTSRGSSGWGFGVGEIDLDRLRVHYRDAARSIDRSLTVAHARIGHIASWQPTRSTAISAALATGGGHLDLQGKVTPLAAARRADLTLETENFPLQTLAPLERAAGLQALAGKLTAKAQIKAIDHPKRGLALDLQGQLHWQAATAALGATDFRARQLSWQGRLKLAARQSKTPATLDAKGRLQMTDAAMTRAGQLRFTQAGADWQGSARATFSRTATRLTSRGRLSARGTRLDSPNRLEFKSDRETLDGGLNLTLTAQQSVITTSGRFQASTPAFSIPGTLRFSSNKLDWDGDTRTTLADDGARIDTQGKLTADRLAFKLPYTGRAAAEHVNWQGRMGMHSATLFSRQAQGKLVADNVRVGVYGRPLRLTAKRLVFDGQYAARPNANGRTLRLTLSGDAHGHRVRALDTAIKAPWFSALQCSATGIRINGLANIRLKKFAGFGVRLLGDTDSNSAVLEAIELHADDFSLNDFKRYRLRRLDVGGADIHVRRDAHGFGVITRFIDSVGGRRTGHKTAAHGTAATAGGASANAAGTTFALEHLTLEGPAISFVDTTTHPAVKLRGSELALTIDGIDSARPGAGARYNLGLDLGAYGHFNSIGTIAPFAPGGPDMKLRAWLRSLALAPLSGYLNAAMSRQIARGAADGTLQLSATKGQLNGLLDTTIANFRLADSATKTTRIAFGISMHTALVLLRGRHDLIHFKTKILGDVTNPYFSIDNLVREAVLAGIRTALLSDYSPVGILNRLKNDFLNLFRSVEDRPALFQPGQHYVRLDDRKYLALIARAMFEHPHWTLKITGQAVPADLKPLHLANSHAPGARAKLLALAREREEAVQDYMAARRVDPSRILLESPRYVAQSQAKPQVSFVLRKSGG